jgi:glycosyltransferase involved in cell wall biosynthesis
MEKAAQLDGSPDSPFGEPFVLYCSTIEARKNHILLARVWQRALEDGVKLPILICVGKWGWAVDDLTGYLAEHPALSSSIIFTGPVSDAQLIRYYQNALFGVMPSRIEGWGYGASECLDFGIPVIVSTAASLLEATRGLMPAIDPDDLPGWYEEIRRWSEDESQRSLYRQQIADRYRPTSTAASWAQIKAELRYADERSRRTKA